jgi:uncharacterized MAPEG superfamily protein
VSERCGLFCLGGGLFLIFQATNMTKKQNLNPNRSFSSILLKAYLNLIGAFLLLFIGIAIHHVSMSSNLLSSHIDNILEQHLLQSDNNRSHYYFGAHITIPLNTLQYFSKKLGNIGLKKENSVFSDGVYKIPIGFRASWKHIPLMSIFLVYLFTLLSKIPVIIAMTIQGNGVYDNRHPRSQQSKLQEGWRARSLAGHLNSIEALNPFAIAVIIYMCRYELFHEINASNFHRYSIVVKECLFFLVIRILYHICYLFNFSTIRSLLCFSEVTVCCSLMIDAMV